MASYYKIEAPLFGSISQINCEAGSIVEENEVLIIMEQMKMYYYIESPCAGVFYPLVTVGTVVSADQMIGKVIPHVE